MRAAVKRFGLFLGFGLIALGVIGVGGAVWGALLYANVKTTPSAPWALPALCGFLWFVWEYSGGRGWPRSTSARRRFLRRANSVSPRSFAWAMVAGLLAIVALAGAWITAFRLFPMPPNPVLPTTYTSSRLWIATIVAGASLLAPITEEVGVRGYLQKTLEGKFTPVTAVVLSSVVFAAAHVTQGVALPKLVLYFVVGATFGTLALVTDSILPVLPVHAIGDVTFFLFVWPHDAGRSLVWQHGTDAWFWMHVAQALVFGVAAVLAFRRIAEHRRTTSSAKALRYDAAEGRTNGCPAC